MFGHHHHHHHGHDHDHDHGHGHGHHVTTAANSRTGFRLRLAAALLILGAAAAAACLVIVSPGEAVVLTRFGNPVRVVTAPGLVWRAPAPIEGVIPVDMRLRTTSNGLQDVGTKDGLRVLVQAYAAWQVDPDPEHVRRYVRAVRNQPNEAAERIRSFLGSALETTASRYDFAALINTNPSAVQLQAFEALLQQRIGQQLLSSYGITVRQVGIERLTLPAEILAATVSRMKAERQTVSAQRMAEGQRSAAKIRADSARDARVIVADSRAEIAGIEAIARAEAAKIYGESYAADPALYRLLRSLDTLEAALGENTRIILRTDAAPFRALVDGPASDTPQ